MTIIVKKSDLENEIYDLFFLNMLFKDSDIPTECYARSWINHVSPNLKSFNSNDKTGKWCIFSTPKNVDSDWLLIKAAIDKNDLMLAKVSTRGSLACRKKYVICVYTNDWSNLDDLKKTREVLRELGFTKPLKYKRDIETINRVYGGKKEFYLTM